MLEYGLNAKAIAEHLGIHRETVLKIKRGEHQGGREKYARCPGCGGLVEQPCRLCLVRDAR